MTLAVSGAWSLLVLSGGLDWLVGRRGFVWIGLGVCDWVGWFAVGRLVFSVWLFCGGLKQAVVFSLLCAFENSQPFPLWPFKERGLFFAKAYCLSGFSLLRAKAGVLVFDRWIGLFV